MLSAEYSVLNPEGHYIINRIGSMISVHFSKTPVKNFEDAAAADNTFFNKFFHAMLKRGIYLPPSAFESWFLSNALTKEDIDETIYAAKESLEEIFTREVIIHKVSIPCVS